MPGVFAVRGPKYRVERRRTTHPDITRLCDSLSTQHSALGTFPLLIVADDSEFIAQTLNNFVWAVFTRSDPANDVYGVGATTVRKHWGCRGPVVIDARLKPHMPPPLECDAGVSKRVDALFARGGPLSGVKG